MTDDRSRTEVIFDSGRFIVSILFAGGFLLLVFEVSQLVEKLDVSKVDPTQLLTIIITGSVSAASAVAGFYFGTRSKG